MHDLTSCLRVLTAGFALLIDPNMPTDARWFPRDRGLRRNADLQAAHEQGCSVARGAAPNPGDVSVRWGSGARWKRPHSKAHCDSSMLHRTDGSRIVASASCQYSDCSGIPFFRSDNINLNAEGAITVVLSAAPCRARLREAHWSTRLSDKFSGWADLMTRKNRRRVGQRVLIASIGPKCSLCQLL